MLYLNDKRSSDCQGIIMITLAEIYQIDGEIHDCYM